MTDMIVAEGLSKQFGKKEKTVLAVDRLSLAIPAGQVFGLLGPNGAGKTTTIRMLAALIGPSSGGAHVAGFEVGKDDQQIRQHVGILTESPGLYDQLSAERNLSFFAALYEIDDIPTQVEKYLRMLGLWNRRSDEVGEFSKGMRQKLAIARALLHEPQVLFLDEPTSGLDPEAARLVRAFIGELKDQGRTILITTHNLSEAEHLCDKVAVFKSRLLALDTPANLRQQIFGRAVVFHLAEARESYAEALAKFPGVQKTQTVDNKLVVTLNDPEQHNPALIAELVRLGAQIQFVGELKRSLEDVYLHLMQSQESAPGEDNE
jgi:ABC-2 type transport system ATP-binding protein